MMTPKQNNDERPVVNLLWTGGWDSTFRLLQLSSKNVIIQPHYLKDENRESQKFELEAIRSITEDIRKLASTRCTIRDLIMVNVSDISEDNEITRAYYKIAEKHRLGIQYEWLARYSKNIHNLEIGDENGRAADSILLGAIKANGAITRRTDGERGEYYVVNRSESSDEIIKLFGNYNYPILFYSKLEMKKEAEEKGFIDLLNKTWFCHTPINNQPCGRCAACVGTIKKGLEHRLSPAALRRYKRKKITDRIKNTLIYNRTRKFVQRMTTVKWQLSVTRSFFNTQIRTGSHH